MNLDSDWVKIQKDWQEARQEFMSAFMESMVNQLEDNIAKIQKDNVNHPAHYTQGGIETIDFIQAKLTPDEFRGYLKGNIIKYATRERFKGKKEDCEKLAWYAKRLSESE